MILFIQQRHLFKICHFNGFSVAQRRGRIFLPAHLRNFAQKNSFMRDFYSSTDSCSLFQGHWTLCLPCCSPKLVKKKNRFRASYRNVHPWIIKICLGGKNKSVYSTWFFFRHVTFLVLKYIYLAHINHRCCAQYSIIWKCVCVQMCA